MFMCTRNISLFCVSMILLKCLCKARNVSDHVYVYLGYQFVCVSMILLKCLHKARNVSGHVYAY